MLEQGTVELLAETGLGERLQREGLVHHGIELRFDGEGHRIDFSGLTGGRTITVYGQQEVVKDLIAGRLDAGGDILFEVADVARRRARRPTRRASRFTHEGERADARVRRRSPAATASTASAARRSPRAC